MAYRLTISDRAAREIGEAHDWYEAQVAGLGRQFVAALDEQFARIERGPGAFPEIRQEIRRALVQRFPYAIFFAQEHQVISILGVVHTSRSPRRWPRLA